MTDTTAGTGTTTTTDPGNAQVDGATATTTDTTQTAATPAADATNAQQTDAGKPDDKPAEPQVPESYEFKMPDGVELDKAAADEFTAIAKELKLDQPTAQKVADVAAKMAQRQTEKHAEAVAQWAQDVKTDKEIGGDNLDQNLATARKAMDSFGTPALKDLLNSTGLGNHPEVIRAFFKAGKAISEDGFVPGGKAVTETDTAKKLFPSMN